MEYEAMVYEGEAVINRLPFTSASDEEAEVKMKGVTPFYFGAKIVRLFRQGAEHLTHVSSWRVRQMIN